MSATKQATLKHAGDGPMTKGGSNFWLKGSWPTGQSALTDGQTSWAMRENQWITFYAGPLTDSIPQQLIWNGDMLYSVQNADGSYDKVTLDLYIQATGIAKGKLDFHDADGTRYDTIDVHAPSTFEHKLAMAAGYSIHVKCSFSTA